MIKTALKTALAHRLRLALTGIAVMLGVTFVAGTFIYTDTLDKVFSTMIDEGASGVDVYVQPHTEFETLMDYGMAGPGLPEEMVEAVRDTDGVHAAEGTVAGYAQFVDKKGNAITPIGPPTLGMSWTRDDGLSTLEIIDGDPPETRLEVAMDAATAGRYGFAVGDDVKILLQGPEEGFELVGIFDHEGEATFAGATLAAFDLETAQRVLGKGDKIDGIEVQAEEGISQVQLRESLAAALPSNVELTTARAEAAGTKDQIQQGFGFFTTILLVFAAIAVFVGAFIIFNTFSIIVAQRMKEFGLLRAIGATQRQVMTTVLIEAAVVSIFASGAGIILGLGAAMGLQGLMDAMGLDMPTSSLEIAPRTVIVGFAVGIGVTLIASLVPARRAAKIPPVVAMRDVLPESRGLKRRRIYIGTALTVLGVGSLAAGLMNFVSDEVLAVGLGAFLLFNGIAILAPVFAKPLAGFLAAPLPRIFGITGTLARENSRRSPKRTASTGAALMIGLALVTLVAMFAASLKGSINENLVATVRSDLIVMSQSFASTSGFSPRIGKELEALPEVEIATPMRLGEWRMPSGASGNVMAFEPEHVADIMSIEVRSGSLDALEDGGVFIEEEEASAIGVAVGDSIERTFGATGKQSIEIDGTYTGGIYGQGDEKYLLSMATFEQNFSRVADLNLHLVAAPGVSAADLRTTVEETLDAYPNVRALDKTQVQDENVKLIDQMINMIYALLALALIIAVLGITNTLALSVHERRREIGLLRAVGATKVQVRRMIRWEAAVLALFGTTLGVAIGALFGWALIVALEDEGFTTVVVPVVQIVVFVVVAGLAGLFAAVMPARRAARLDVLRAIAYE